MMYGTVVIAAVSPIATGPLREAKRSNEIAAKTIAGDARCPLVARLIDCRRANDLRTVRVYERLLRTATRSR